MGAIVDLETEGQESNSLKLKKPVITINPLRGNSSKGVKSIAQHDEELSAPSEKGTDAGARVKKMGEIAETIDTLNFMDQKEENVSELSVKPLELTQEGAPRLAMVFLILALVVAGISVFMFAKEFATRKQTSLELARTEQARTELEQSLVKLQSEMANQREEINRLSLDLEAAQAKAALIDKLREEHEEQISRVKNRYEGELAALQKVLEAKESLISSLQSNLKGIRELLQKGETPVGAALAAGGVGAVESVLAPGSAQISSPPEFRPTSGTVLTVNRDHHFVIMNLSIADGAWIGRFVQIYQKDKPIGQGRIDRVYQSLSAATVLSEDTLERVEKGDQIFLALE